MKKIIFIAILLASIINCFGQIDLYNFTFNGSAKNIGGSCYELTPNLVWHGGTIWSAQQIDLNQSFVVEAELFLGCKYTNDDCGLAGDDDGADGMVFALQQLSTEVGTEGGQLGFGGFDTSFGVEFDTYYNTEYNDPVEDHIAILKNGSVTHNTINTIAGPVALFGNIEDCNYHKVKIEWIVESMSVNVYFDCEPILGATVDLVNDIFNGNSKVYWGFTAATGSCSNEHKICFSLPPTFSKNNTISICKGDTVQLHNLEKPENYSFRWLATQDILNPDNFNPLVNPSTNTGYILELSNECNDILEYNFVVEVNECDCNKTANGTAEIDECGECLESNDPNFGQSCRDCKGLLNGTALVDECGDCLEPGDPNFNQACTDCSGIINGPFVIDDCGECVNSDFNASCTDCMGVLFGTALVDECGDCLAVDDPTYNQSCTDCDGVVNGLATIDDCGNCLETFNPMFNACKDCSGVVFGTAIMDSCMACLLPNDPNFNQSCRKDVHIPNAFSPNEDGLNDTFEIFVPGDIASFDLLIYNRWGQKVFYSNSNFEMWDGKDQPLEVYVYQCKIRFNDGTIQSYKGNVTLVK